MAPSSLFIGKVAAQVGLNPKTIRYYEQIGLVPKPERTESRYRLYAPEVIDLLHFIKQAQGFGLRLSEIKEIIAIRQQGHLPCVHVRALLKEKIADLDRKMADLKMLRDRLQALLKAWNSQIRRGKADICPHIEHAPLEIRSTKR